MTPGALSSFNWSVFSSRTEDSDVWVYMPSSPFSHFFLGRVSVTSLLFLANSSVGQRSVFLFVLIV